MGKTVTKRKKSFEHRVRKFLAELGLFFKMNRAFFADKSENMALVTTLMNFTADVNEVIATSIAF